jgi:surfeit locus 1 family protein
VTRAQAIRGLMLPGMLSLAALAVLISLGNWQMQRLAWKENLIASVSERVRQPLEQLPPQSEWQKLNLEQLEYRPFATTGRFDHSKEVHVYTVLSDPKGSFSGAGYWILTPLLLDGGGIVVINRGFVPQELKDPASRPQGQVNGQVRVTGFLRLPEEANYFTPVNDPARGIWFRRDPRAIANVLKLQDVAPFMLDATGDFRPNVLPQQNETKISFTNNHLGYALTWYGLACTLIGVFSAFAWQRLHAAK